VQRKLALNVRSRSSYLLTFTFTFSHLADAFVQSDVQGREQSSYEQPWGDPSQNKKWQIVAVALMKKRAKVAIFTNLHLTHACIQSDAQSSEQSSYEQ